VASTVKDWSSTKGQKNNVETWLGKQKFKLKISTKKIDLDGVGSTGKNWSSTKGQKNNVEIWLGEQKFKLT